MLSKVGEKVPLKVMAAFTDGSRRDVTSNSVFDSTNTAVLDVAPGGVVSGKRWGGGAILARYLGTIGASFITLPQERKGPYPAAAEANVIDRYVFDNLKRLNVIPSPVSGDAEFVRRVYLDELGRLPLPDEVETFLKDVNRDKRAKLIDALLEKP